MMLMVCAFAAPTIARASTKDTKKPIPFMTVTSFSYPEFFSSHPREGSPGGLPKLFTITL
jgi:hypothetical protein